MRVSILGVTGSIGQSTVDVLLHSDVRPNIDVDSVVAQRDAVGLAKAAIALKAQFAAIEDETKLEELRALLLGTSIDCGAGKAAVIEAASRPVDKTMAAISGTSGLEPTLAAIKAGNTILLANKESMVCAGPHVKELAVKHGVEIIPVDSEHNAIFQVLSSKMGLNKITLTASGGPFRQATLPQMRRASREHALAHPNWAMGAKNSLDSATLMNKGLELIEAAYLFDLPEDRIDVLVHPQSIIHGMASFDDGSVLAQLGAPDMRTPIAYALSAPNRIKTNVETLDLCDLASLTFESVDHERFPAISLARASVRRGAVGSCFFNASNELAGELFLSGKCGFLDISDIVSRVLDRAFGQDADDIPKDVESLDDVIQVGILVDRWINDMVGFELEGSQ